MAVNNKEDNELNFDFFDEEEIIENVSALNRNIPVSCDNIIFYINIRSLNANFNELEVFIERMVFMVNHSL